MHARALIPALASALLLACQPADEPALQPGEAEEVGEAASEPVGAPDTGLPEDLEALLDDLRSTAGRWNRDATVSEIVVDLGAEGEWVEATVTYLAPDADRFLELRVGPDGVAEERPTLAGFDLHPVSADGLEAVPSPDGLLDPDDFSEAAAAVLDDCGVEGPQTVLYTSGAPAAWDGESWTEELRWRAAIRAGDVGAVVDGETGEPVRADPCVEL